MRNILHVEADIKGQRRIPAYTVTQNDSVSIVVSVLDGGSPVNLDEVSTMTIACTRRDGAVVVKDGTQTGPNEVTFDLGTTEIEQTGKVDAVIQLYSADGRVSTIKFSFMVTKDPTGDGYVPSEEERTLIEVVLGDGPLTIERAEMAAASAEGATAYIDEKKPLIDKFTDEQTNLQAQLDEVARGATNAETSQARVSTTGTAYGTLKQRLDTEYEEVMSQLAQTTSNILNIDKGWGVAGDGITDDTQAIQNAINHAVENGLDVYIPKGNYFITNDIKIENAENTTITVQQGAEFTTEGNHTGIDLYPSSPKVPMQMCFFAIIDSENVTFTGGSYECSGFPHHGDGRAASGIVVLRSKGTVVERTRIVNLKPSNIAGGTQDQVNGNTVNIRYTGILAVKSKDTTIQNNYAKTMGYSAFECRIACENTKFIGNYAEDCYQHMVQPTMDYGTMLESDVLEGDWFNRGVVIAYNTAVGENTDITTHAKNVTIFGNTMIDVSNERTFSFRAYSDGVTCFGNTAICTKVKGDVCFDVQLTAENVVIYNNVVNNYTNAINHRDGKADYSGNTYINVDDVGNYVSFSGYKAGAKQTGDFLTSVGAEAGLSASGDSNTFVGFRSGRESIGQRTTAIGHESARGNTQNNATALGYQAGLNNKGTNSTFFGEKSGSGNTGNGVLMLGSGVGINNPYNNVVGLGATPTADHQVNIDNRHIELKNTPEPSTPDAGRARLWLNSNRLYVIFDDGTKVRIADNL